MTMFEEIKALTKSLVAVASVNGTAGERAIGEAIEAYLRDIPYFRENPSLVITQELADDPLHRRNIMALLKGGDGNEADTILLHGHTDTVDVDDYGALRDYAFDCDALAEQLAHAALPADVRRDLESGEYLFGRGACDMKGGVAVFLVLARHLAAQPARLRGNLLLSFNPVEETLHQGIIEELPVLARLRDEHGLRFRLAINNDFICPMYAGDTTRYVYTGAVGKLLPMFYVIGRETHVAQCFEGFSADAVAAELLQRIELSTDLCDSYQGECSLPPSALKMTDLKPSYNVQTPHTALVYFNLFVHNRQTADLLDQLKQTARQALNAVMQRADARYRVYCDKAGLRYTSLLEPTQVLDYRALYARAKAAFDGDLDAEIDRVLRESVAAGEDKRLSSLAVVRRLGTLSGIKTPTVVVFFATPFCPHNTLKAEDPAEAAVRDELAAIAADFGAQHNETMRLMQFFPSLTDSSYLKIDDDDASVAALIDNFPGYQTLYPVPLDAAKGLNIPAVNYGVWGKDCHKWTERIHMPYSFGKLPQFLLQTIDHFIGATSATR